MDRTVTRGCSCCFHTRPTALLLPETEQPYHGRVLNGELANLTKALKEKIGFIIIVRAGSNYNFSSFTQAPVKSLLMGLG